MRFNIPLLDDAVSKIKGKNFRIAFSEPQDERILKAALELHKEGIVKPVLVGERPSTNLDISSLEFVVPDDRYAKVLFEHRKGKITLDDCAELSKQNNYFASLLLNDEKVDGLVSGAVYTTAQTFRPALQIIKTKDKVVASTYFLMIIKDKTYLFADCALNINPNESQLADIALSTAQSALKYGLTPKVAMLSFSTNSSASHELVDKVSHATKIVKDKQKDLIIEGEIQVDVALVEEIAQRKFADSKIKGDANIFIFPDLNAGNIGYKLVERFADAKAIGPISQGFNKPVNDLSRGCSVEDIKTVAILTALQVLG